MRKCVVGRGKGGWFKWYPGKCLTVSSPGEKGPDLAYVNFHSVSIPKVADFKLHCSLNSVMGRDTHDQLL